MESLEINSANIIGNTGEDKTFIDLSNIIYNRHTHDKNMSAVVSEINFMVGLESIIHDANDKKELCNLIDSNYNSLFSVEFINEIKNLKEEDYKSICCYYYNEKNKCKKFYGLEYHILRYLKDYHLSVFKDDISNGRLNKIIKLDVRKDNLIVKVFPKNSTDDNSVSYTISLFYLVIWHLYKYTSKNVYENLYQKGYARDNYINWVIKHSFISIQPIITKVSYQVKVNADDNYTWFTQLKQLTSAYKFLNITTNENQVKFLFRPKEHYLATTLKFTVTNNTPSETNTEKRFIQCSYKLDKNNILFCETTIVSKEMVDCAFATQIDEQENLSSMYSSLSDNETIYLAQYSILKRLLSFTQQHETLKRNNIQLITNRVRNGGYIIVDEDDTKINKVKLLTEIRTIKHAFKDVKQPTPDDELVKIIREELLKLGCRNNHTDYLITILELFEAEKSIIDNTLAELDVKTSEVIKKVIKKLKRQKFTTRYSLNEFYRGF